MKLVSLLTLMVVLLSACGAAATGDPYPQAGAQGGLPESGRKPGGALAGVAMKVYKSPACSCCGRWIEYVRAQGAVVAIEDSADVNAIKVQSKVPNKLYSCHTTMIDGYVVEGHVPLAAIERLLAERPAIAGIAVAGMPPSSPGMEIPGNPFKPYDVMAFDAAGASSLFMTISQ